MELLDLPLDIIRLVFQETAWLLDFDELNHVRLVNKTFDREVTAAVASLLRYYPRWSYRATAPQAVELIYQGVIGDVSGRFTLPSLIAHTVDYLLDHTEELEKRERETYIRKLCERSVHLNRKAYNPSVRSAISRDLTASEKWPGLVAAVAAFLGCSTFLANLPNIDTVIFQSSTQFGRPLAAAAASGQLSIVKWILGRYLELGYKYVDSMRVECGAALPDACSSGNQLVVREFLDSKYGFRREDKLWVTAFREAGASGSVEVVKMIADHRWELKTGLELALGSACRQGHAAVVAFCLSQGADPTRPMSRTLKYTERRKLNSPYSLAALNGHYEVVKIIFSHMDGRPAPQHEKLPWPPSMLAAMKGHKNVVEFLLENGDSSEQLVSSLLGLAALGGHADLVKYLLRELAKFSPSSQMYAGALQNAERKGWTSVADLIRKDMSNSKPNSCSSLEKEAN